MILDNKNWLNSKGFSDADIDLIIKYSQGYPADERSYNDQLKRLRQAKKHFQAGLIQMKAIANSFPTIMADIDVIYTQIAEGNDRNMLIVNTPLTLEDNTNGEVHSLIESLEQTIASISAAASPLKSALICNSNEPPMELKLTTGKGQLINQLHHVWLQKGNKVTVSETSDFMTFLAIIFDDNKEESIKWKGTFQRICIKKYNNK